MSISVGPTSGPSPQTTWKSPFGSPASSSIWTPYNGESAVLLSGLSTIPLPAISAEIESEMPVANGKFQGAMIPMTPLGWRISVEFDTSGTGPPRLTGLSRCGARLR